MIEAVLGCDPGTKGGVALLRGDGVPLYVQPLRPDMTEIDVLNVIRGAIFSAGMRASPPPCYFEKVGYLPSDGGMGAFTFGKINGLMRGILIAMEVKIYDVTPVIWQSNLNCMSGGNKNVTKRKAMELFPTIKMTHAIADALLIAYFGLKRQNQTGGSK